ncbi:hypothetical protein MMC30_001621 [Trapelia coarctata]|nr:hypothetical protein [Trapelia coarctata]
MGEPITHPSTPRKSPPTPSTAPHPSTSRRSSLAKSLTRLEALVKLVKREQEINRLEIEGLRQRLTELEAVERTEAKQRVGPSREPDIKGRANL